MSQRLVRVIRRGLQVNVSAAQAKARGETPLAEPVRNRDGSIRRPTRANGRPLKPRLSISEAAARKRRRRSRRATSSNRQPSS